METSRVPTRVNRTSRPVQTHKRITGTEARSTVSTNTVERVTSNKQLTVSKRGVADITRPVPSPPRDVRQQAKTAVVSARKVSSTQQVVQKPKTSQRVIPQQVTSSPVTRRDVRSPSTTQYTQPQYDVIPHRIPDSILTFDDV